jgi:hypothetical protein
MALEPLLSAALETGLGFLAEVGFGNEIRALQERLTKSDEPRWQEAFERAFTRAREASGEEAPHARARSSPISRSGGQWTVRPDRL